MRFADKSFLRYFLGQRIKEKAPVKWIFYCALSLLLCPSVGIFYIITNIKEV
ncbi:hypothetical protein HMPREF1705_04156 [Acetomicrobium hydrogeniformans ATCC BAA-1850]|jgi:hypothetical protein|uniref:Uncharacterized protein n=1 Tax=Acetomicrobium hydrogeniformans ATCC BAA-1850 TaxID=592015 RepID=A0A0T5X972_9BACT|nr:hypothetical protein HMPREF1705_04156 [Acetomicrobium hydrogeniformans ATCC BAA-1850]